MVDETIISGVRHYLNNLEKQGIAVSMGIIFGSRVHGTFSLWSDIDLVVVSPVFDGEYSREMVSKLWRTAARTDNRIEPIPCGERQWLEDAGSPILEIARGEGIIVNSEQTI